MSQNIGKIGKMDGGRILSIGIVGSLIGLVTVAYLAWFRVLKQEKGEKKMVAISDNIKQGAKAFLNKEYQYIAVFVFIMFIIIAAASSWSSAISFLVGAILSAGCGYTGMLIAVEANVRTANAAKRSLNDALQVAFGSGGVMGLSVVCVGMLGLSILYGSVHGVLHSDTMYLASFGFGASSIALFARVGGGIFTKAADVGADLVGKVEANIPEDDPKNPATIADNVGDNVGDVAGMGADLFESYVGAIIASIQLADMGYIFHSTTPTAWQDLDLVQVEHFIALPFWVAGFGIICSIIGILMVRTNQKSRGDKQELQMVLLQIIRRGINTAAILTWILSWMSCGSLFGFKSRVAYKLWGCITVGLVAGVSIGFCTEFATSFTYKPTISIAKKSRIGSAGVVIQGIGIGMLSTMFPVLIIFATLLACYGLSGTYGIGIAAVGMLSTLGITLATDAFGPVADNAGGIAEMAELDEHVRQTTDGLDALGNTTAATGKGFAIGSAVLTALALLGAFKDDSELLIIDISDATVLSAAIFGACLPYIFAALTMLAVGRAAGLMVEEVRRQFREYKLLAPEEEWVRPPDYQQCVAISTHAAIVEMIIPGLLAVISPLFIGFFLGSEALGGMLIGCILSGFMLAVFMANSGGAWDNAKKFIEAKGLGEGRGKGSDFHKAAVVGDTIGDPFKDTSGPSLNILIKLMTIIAIVFVKSFGQGPYNRSNWFAGIIIFLLFLVFAIGLTLYLRRAKFGKIRDQHHPPQQVSSIPTSPPSPSGSKEEPDVELQCIPSETGMNDDGEETGTNDKEPLKSH